MPVLDSTDYERFSYDEPNGSSLTLDDAVKKARELRRADQGNFYRVQVVDQNANSFRVQKVPVGVAYTDFLARLAKTMTRYARVAGKV
jgi:hypothetical protein